MYILKMNRQFSSGSRQAPDPLDKFLEKHSFYRKHTARDSSCLFRVISEQVYDTQMHHEYIRKRCVIYMRKNRELFESYINGDIDEYLDDMSKPKTYGTFVELRAAGYLFQRNIIIFEPFTLGTLYLDNSKFIDDIRVFHTPERHFDSVYTLEYIKDVAVCQSICYEILYKDFFKVADISYAVEYMLHQQTFDVDHYEESNDYGYSIRMNLLSGQSFPFDLPHETNCILENYKLCHFHNKNFSFDLHKKLKERNEYVKVENRDMSAVTKRSVESALGHKYISCVRQLLKEGITPFPYKVAKALDSSMYRNIEFDCWNEARKESRWNNWYLGDTNFMVGAKCNVKLPKSENEVYTCHIQEISQDKGNCVVFVEQLGEKHVVSYESLTPLPPEQFKPWSLPYRYHKNMHNYNPVRFMRHYNYRWKLDRYQSQTQYCDNQFSSHKSSYELNEYEKNNFYRLKKFTNLENFTSQSFEYCTMPITVEASPNNFMDQTQTTGGNALNATNHNGGENDPVGIELTSIEGNVDHLPAMLSELNLENGGTAANSDLATISCIYPMQTFETRDATEDFYNGDTTICHPQSIQAVSNGGTLYYMYNQYNNIPTYCQSAQSAAAFPPRLPLLSTQNPLNAPQNCFYYPVTSYCAPNTDGLLYQPIPPQNNDIVEVSSNTQTHRGGVNYEAKKSLKTNGVDLPPDVDTLRYFYNLGIDYYRNNQSTLKTEDTTISIPAMSTLNVEDNLVENENQTLDNLTINDHENSLDVNASSVEKNEKVAQVPAAKPPKFNNTNNCYQRRYMRERSNYNNNYVHRSNNNINDFTKNSQNMNGLFDNSKNLNMKYKTRTITAKRNNENPNMQLGKNVNAYKKSPTSYNDYELSQLPSNNNIPVSNAYAPTNININGDSNECAYDYNGVPNNCVQMPLTPCQPPYGFYSQPPPGVPPTVTSSPYAPPPTGVLTNIPVLGMPQSVINTGYYPPPVPPQHPIPEIVASNRGDIPPPMHYRYVNYPPPMPLYCANVPGGVAGATIPAQPSMGPQGFWCLPPSPNTPTPLLPEPPLLGKSGGNNVSGIPYKNGNTSDPGKN